VIQCNIRNITARKEIENGLEKARKELTELAAADFGEIRLFRDFDDD
jgi:hypothetical protein